MDGGTAETHRASLDLHGKRVEFATLALCAIGAVMVYSATSPYWDKSRTLGVESTLGTLTLQFTKLGMAFVAFLLGRFLSLDLLRRASSRILLLSVATLALVPLLGITLNGSNRWLQLGAFTFQPVEMVKLAVVMFLAAKLAALGPRIERLGTLVALVAVAIGPALLLLQRQPDFGSSVFLFGICLVLLIIAGARFVHYAGGVVAGFAVLYLIAMFAMPHVVERFQKHSDPKPGDQVYQALLALGVGGYSGIEGGIGAGIGKLGYVPMIQSDFIFAAIGEETGFLGSSIVIALFVMLTYAGARIALLQRDRFRFLLASGLVIEIAVQALINLAVVTALGPTKGIALPFISSGGSALMFSLFGIGLLVNLSRSPAVESASAVRYADVDEASAAPKRVQPSRRPLPAGIAAREKVVVHHG